MSSEVTQETLDAINAALPDQLMNLEVVSLVLCIMLGYGFTKEMIAEAAEVMSRTVMEFIPEEEDNERSSVDSTAPEA